MSDVLKVRISNRRDVLNIPLLKSIYIHPTGEKPCNICADKERPVELSFMKPLYKGLKESDIPPFHQYCRCAITLEFCDGSTTEIEAEQLDPDRPTITTVEIPICRLLIQDEWERIREKLSDVLLKYYANLKEEYGKDSKWKKVFAFGPLDNLRFLWTIGREGKTCSKRTEELLPVFKSIIGSGKNIEAREVQVAKGPHYVLEVEVEYITNNGIIHHEAWVYDPWYGSVYRAYQGGVPWTSKTYSE